MKIKNFPFITFKKTNEIFKQLEEKKDRQPFKLTKRIKGTISLFLATTIVLSTIYAFDYLGTHENNV